MNQLSKISVILPSYNPGKEVIPIIKNIIEQGFCDIIMINDGSNDEYLPIFDEAAKIGGCSVLRHDRNKGKGASLKTGMKFFMENRKDFLGVITVDDDGQHLPQDVKQCAQKMAQSGALVLGSRDFQQSSVPIKSRIGNKVAAKLFNLLGLHINDSQTGLRAIPRRYINTLANVSGSRFEYETNMLLTAKKECFDIIEVRINVVYFEGNKKTHFKAVKDSLIVMLQFLKYSLGSLLSWAVDISCFYALLNLLNWNAFSESWNVIFLSTVIARVISSIINFIFNRNIVFGHKNNLIKTALKYYLLCCVSMALSGAIVSFCSNVLNISNTALITLIKIIVDSGLFIMNFFVQKRLVFK